MSSTETWLIFNYADKLAASAQTCLVADDTHETRQFSSRVALCKLSSRLTSILQLISQVIWHGFLHFANDTIYASAYMRDMQLLGACAHNFLLVWSAMTPVAVLLQSAFLWLLNRSCLGCSYFSSNTVFYRLIATATINFR